MFFDVGFISIFHRASVLLSLCIFKIKVVFEMHTSNLKKKSFLEDSVLHLDKKRFSEKDIVIENLIKIDEEEWLDMTERELTKSIFE